MTRSNFAWAVNTDDEPGPGSLALQVPARCCCFPITRPRSSGAAALTQQLNLFALPKLRQITARAKISKGCQDVWDDAASLQRRGSSRGTQKQNPGDPWDHVPCYSGGRTLHSHAGKGGENPSKCHSQTLQLSSKMEHTFRSCSKELCYLLPWTDGPAVEFPMQNQQLRLEIIYETKVHQPLHVDPPPPCSHAAWETPHQGTEPGMLLLRPHCILLHRILLPWFCQ